MVWMILFFLMTGTGTAVAKDNHTAAQLEQRYDQESNPKKQAEIAVDLTKKRLKQLRSAYLKGNQEQEKVAVDDYLGALDRLETAVDAAENVGTSKKAEMFLRKHGRDLEGLKTDVAYYDRPEIKKLCDRAAELREQILYSIMSPKED